MARFSLYRFLRQDRGAAVIEFGIVAPLLFLIIWAIIAFGQGYTRLNVLTGALRHGARVASTLNDPCVLQKDLVDSAVSQHSMAFGAHVDVTSPAYSVSCSNPGEVRVRAINYPLFSGIDFFGIDSLLVTREAVFKRELP
jgi:Flp pilus assembly protein TadG